MAEVQYNFQSSVWHYTYANGPDSGVVLFESPQRFWGDTHAHLVLRQTNATAANRAWVNRDRSLVRRCRILKQQQHQSQCRLLDHHIGRKPGKPDNDDDIDLPNEADAHGVLIKDGWGAPILEDRPPPATYDDDGSRGGPLVPYRRGERVWIDDCMPRPEFWSQGDGTETSDDDDDDDDFFIPVISLDSLHRFRVKSKYICFVPQLARFVSPRHQHGFPPSSLASSSATVFATPVGPVRESFGNGRRMYHTQAYFEWPSNQPSRAVCKWETWLAAAPAETVPPRPRKFHRLTDVEERRAAFRRHWAILSGQFSVTLDDDTESVDSIDLVVIERGIRHVGVAVAL